MVTLHVDDTIIYEVKALKFDTQTGVIDFDNSAEIKEHITEICTILKHRESYDKAIESLCGETYKQYRYGLFRGLCGTSLHEGLLKQMKLFAHMILNHREETYLLNAFQCETHRWVIERALRNIIRNK